MDGQNLRRALPAPFQGPKQSPKPGTFPAQTPQVCQTHRRPGNHQAVGIPPQPQGVAVPAAQAPVHHHHQPQPQQHQRIENPPKQPLPGKAPLLQAAHQHPRKKDRQPGHGGFAVLQRTGNPQNYRHRRQQRPYKHRVSAFSHDPVGRYGQQEKHPHGGKVPVQLEALPKPPAQQAHAPQQRPNIHQPQGVHYPAPGNQKQIQPRQQPFCPLSQVSPAPSPGDGVAGPQPRQEQEHIHAAV